ncbi:MAG: VOC family protein [Candidatus Krumholzibacteriia bacterium]
MSSPGNEQPRIESLSAVTLVTRDMARSVRFYRRLGFRLLHGGEQEPFTSFAVGDAYLNLIAPEHEVRGTLWGRVIFHVSDVDEVHRRVLELGLQPQAAPRDAEWGERYFHLTDPDGHELSFARPLRRASTR